MRPQPRGQRENHGHARPPPRKARRREGRGAPSAFSGRLVGSRLELTGRDGAAEGELSLARARQAFEDIEFHPDVLRPAEHVDTSTEVLGGPSALPFGIASAGEALLRPELLGLGAAVALALGPAQLALAARAVLA